MDKQEMLRGNPLNVIIQFSIPIFLGILFQQIYTSADTIIVSKILGDQALAAVGCLNSVNFLILGFCNGMGGGFGIPIALSYGAKDHQGLKKYLGNALWLYLIIATVGTVISVALCKQILIITNTPSDIFDMAYIYMVTIFVGIPAQFAYNTLTGIIRSLGDSKNPLYILILCSFLNIIFDLLFIIVFHMGVFGAALATVLAQVISVIGCLGILYYNFKEIRLQKEDLKWDNQYILPLLKNGLPMGLQMSICGIGSLLLQSSVNALGSIYVASVTASERIWQILQSVSASLGSALTVYCGQNVGAKQYKRLRQGIRSTTLLAMVYCVLSTFVIYFFGRGLIGLFINKNSVELMDLSYHYLVITGIFFFAQGLIHTLRFSIQGMGYAHFSLIAAMLEMVARSFIGVAIVPKYGFIGACFSNPLAWICADLFIVPAYFWIIKKFSRL